jgi:hypothetical protein
MEEKEMLLELQPDLFFETAHYKGWPVVLLRLSRADAATLRHHLDRAWRLRAPKRLLATYEAGS